MKLNSGEQHDNKPKRIYLDDVRRGLAGRNYPGQGYQAFANSYGVSPVQGIQSRQYLVKTNFTMFHTPYRKYSSVPRNHIPDTQLKGFV